MFKSRKSPHAKPPGKRRRLLWMLAGLLLAAAVILAAGVGYLVWNPSSVKPLIERVLSAQARAAVTIEHLELGIDPLRLDARGIAIAPAGEADGFALDARALAVRAALSGPFGSKTLRIESLRLENTTCRLSPPLALPARLSGAKPSLAGRLLIQLVQFLLFADVAVDRVAVLDTRVIFETATGLATLSMPSIRSDPDGAVRIVADARLAAAGGPRQLALPDIRVDIAPPGLAAFGQLAAKISLRDGFIADKAGEVSHLSGSAALRYDRQDTAVFIEKLRLKGRVSAAPEAAGAEFAAVDAAFAANGDYRLDTRQLTVSGWSLAGGDLFTLNGSGRLRLSGPYPFALQLADGRIDSARLHRRLMPTVSSPELPVSLSGPINLLGELQGRFGDAPDTWQGMLEVSADRMPLELQTAGMTISSRAGVALRMSGSPLDPQLQAKLTLADATLAGAAVELEPFDATIEAAGRYPAFQTNARIDIPRMALKTRTRTLGLRQVTVSAENGRIDLQSGEAMFPSVAMTSDTLRNLSVAIDRSKQGIQMVVTGRDTAWTSAAADWGLIPSDWTISGSDRLDATVIIGEQQQVLITSKAAVGDFSAVSPNERYIIDSLSAAAEVNARYRPEERRLTSLAQLSVTAGEVLLGRYYHDFKTNGLTLSGRAARSSATKQITIDGIRLQVGGLLGLQASGNIATTAPRPAISATVLLADTALPPLFRHFVLEPYKFENPSLEKLSLGGTISGQLQLSNPQSGWSLRGGLAWNNGRIAIDGSSVSAEGIELDFPLWHQPDTAAAGGPPIPGSLRIARLQLPLIPPQPLKLAFRAGPGSLTTTAPVDLRLGDGRLQLGPARITSIYSGQPRLQTSAVISGVILRSLVAKADNVCGGGRLDGRIDRIELTDGNLSGSGLVTADICGGRIEIRNPSVRRLFSASPAVRFDSTIDAIDLEQLTAGTSFGRIRGILSGWVRGLQIVGGQPEAFQLLLETVPTPGVSQRINVRAVENIASLGGGQSPFMGIAGTVVANLFKEFSYSTIGIRAELKNDTFRINGTVRENGKEYLVKKGGLSGVDVINLNPDNRISFRDMVKRIKRIQTSKGAATVQ